MVSAGTAALSAQTSSLHADGQFLAEFAYQPSDGVLTTIEVAGWQAELSVVIARAPN
jgi:hypothetical protein